MASASLLGLPTELKAYIVSLVAQQDDRFRVRTSTRRELELPTLPGSEGHPYEHPTGKVGKSLSELSCVNKELRALAAPHLFQELKASRMGDRILQYSILQSYPTAFSTLNFDSTRDAHLLESTLAVAHTLTNITSVTIATDAAFALFCAKGVDQLALGALRKMSKNVVSLRLSGPENAEDVFLALLVECFSNLKRLEIVRGAFAGAGTALATAVDSRQHLEDLQLDLEGNPHSYIFGDEWSQHPWTCPLRRLEIVLPTMDGDSVGEWDFISAFSDSLEWLEFQTKGIEGSGRFIPQKQPASNGEPRFPRLRTLFLRGQPRERPLQEPFDSILEYLSDSLLVDLHYTGIPLELITLEDPLLKVIATSLPTLRFLDVDPLFGDDERFLQDFCDSKLIKLEHRHSTSLFHDPSLAQVDEPAPTLEALKRVLDFGRASVERAEREGDTAAMERLLSILGSLEDERLRWTD